MVLDKAVAMRMTWRGGFRVLLATVFEVFVQHLVAPYLILPYLRFEILKVFVFVDEESLFVLIVTPEFDDILTLSLIPDNRLVEFVACHQVQVLSLSPSSAICLNSA